MNKLLLGIFAVAAPFATQAFAADMAVKAPPKPVAAFTWSGCYVGGFVGGDWSGNSTARDLNGYNGPDTWSYRDGSSVTGGGTLGCNQQIGSNFVLGIEGEGGYLHSRGSALDPLSPFLPLDTTASTRIGDAYGVLAMRAGVAFNRTLLYVKAGAALTEVKVSVLDPNPAGGNTISAIDSANKSAVAFAIGGGLEYAFSDKWSAKAEYLYLDYRRTDTACGLAAVGGGNFCWSVSVPGVSTAKVGLNYKLN
jgi:outer membrane immunogenic protein